MRWSILRMAIVSLAFLFTGPQTALPEIQSKHEEKEIRFSHNAINLAASLLLPLGAGPFPAVVIVHGSGTSDRSNPWTTAYAQGLVQRGVAVLYPDKRGSGKSQGDWHTASFLDLADDAIAGVEWLRSNPGIDKERIGVIGFSQGGHIIAAAAARSPHIAFAIDVSGSTVPILEQAADEIEMSAERAGLTDKQIRILKDVNQKGIHFFLTGQGWEQYQAALNAAKTGELKGQEIMAGFPTEPKHWMAAFIQAVGNFDPIAYWKKVTIPILFVYGGQDTQIRVTKSLKRIETALSANKRNYAVILLNRNGHALYREDLLAF